MFPPGRTTRVDVEFWKETVYASLCPDIPGGGRSDDMRILVFGSLNIDKVYALSDFVRPGETVAARKMDEFCGGKGFNQAIALRRAGNEVHFAGAVGADGQMLLNTLDKNGICRDLVQVKDGATGHAIIQVDDKGGNCIIILAGTNGKITPEDAKNALSGFGEGDLLVVQNEISSMPDILRLAKGQGMTVAFNPSPFNEKVALCDIAMVDYLLINETEGQAMTGCGEKDAILDALKQKYPAMNVVLTLGGDGSVYQAAGGERTPCGIYRTKAVDTTAAGDTFTGYFLGEILSGAAPANALKLAAVAAGISVSRAGAEPSIPTREEVLEALKTAQV